MHDFFVPTQPRELSTDRCALGSGLAAAAQVAAEARGAARVRGAERGHGLPGPHLHGGLHGGRPGGAGAGAGAVRALRHVPGPAAAHPPLLPVPPQELRAVPAHVAAAPPPLRALRPPRPLRHPALHVSAAIDTALTSVASLQAIHYVSSRLTMLWLCRAGGLSRRSRRRRQPRPAMMATNGGF